MTWSVIILPHADQELDELGGGDKKRREELEEGILDEFEGMKGDRVTKLFRQGVTTASIDRLDGSQFHGSIRIQIFADYRATVLCFPEYEQAYVMHVFHKSQDPKYKNALATHDKRVAEFVDSFFGFVNKKRRR